MFVNMKTTLIFVVYGVLLPFTHLIYDEIVSLKLRNLEVFTSAKLLVASVLRRTCTPSHIWLCQALYYGGEAQ